MKRKRRIILAVFAVMFAMLCMPQRAEAARKAVWKDVDGVWYAYRGSKLVRNKWVGDYYVGENGKKVRNTWIDNRYLDADGKWDRTKPVPVPLEGIKVSTTGTLLKPGKTSGIDLYFFPENTTDGNLPMNRLQRLKTAS